MKDDLIEYLKMIQSTVERMSSMSAMFKGFAAAIVSAVSALSYKSHNISVLLLSYIPILIFLILDLYYLQLERRFRYLYEQVRTQKYDVCFDIRPPKVKKILEIEGKNSKSGVRMIDCLKSPSIWLFYVPIVIICVAVVLVKIGGKS